MENIKKLFEELSEDEIVQMLLMTMESKRGTGDFIGQKVIFVLEEHTWVEGEVTGTLKSETKDGISSTIVVHKKGLKRPRDEGETTKEHEKAPEPPQTKSANNKGLYDDE